MGIYTQEIKQTGNDKSKTDEAFRPSQRQIMILIKENNDNPC